MLILTRRIGESLMVGDDVKVTVMDIKGNQVRVGIDADKKIQVHREEVYRRIKKAEEDSPASHQRIHDVQATKKRKLMYKQSH